ncbi:MAG: tRNA (adenosine(37)-N6)-threonylcarbamoyltransferase complex ATPase subunit type 1 TsaE [Patescibacteria group bacterium]
MANTFLSKSPSETKKIGADLAKNIKKNGSQNKACILALEGDLGGGKTTFLQGFAKGLGIEEKILSPTFVIMKRFKIPCRPCLPGRQPADRKDSEFKDFHHLDCYRLKDAREVLDLGFKDILLSPGNIVAVEWGEKIKKILPESAIWIEFKFIFERSENIPRGIDDKKRKITISE